MATIDNVPDWEASRALILKLDGPGLIAQHLVQRGAVHALQSLVEFGVTTENVGRMLVDLKVMQDFVAATAAMRGIQLVSED